MPWARNLASGKRFASSSNTAMNSWPMPAPLLLRVLDPGEAREEPVGGVDAVDREAEARRTATAPCRPRPGAAGRCRRRSDAVRSPTASRHSSAVTEESTPPDSATMIRPSADLLADPGHGVAPDLRRRPVAAGAADVDEVEEDPAAEFGVVDLGVELDPVETARLVGHRRGRRVVRPADGVEAGRQARDPVAVRHPDPLRRPGSRRTAGTSAPRPARRRRTRGCPPARPGRRAGAPSPAARSTGPSTGTPSAKTPGSGRMAPSS